MIPQNHDPLKEALAGDRLISQDVIFGKLAIWVLKLATVGTTGVFTWSLLSSSLPKDASAIMVAFAGVGSFMAEICFLLATIWIKISRNGIQTSLAWTIFGLSLAVLLANTIAGAILAESKQATLGRGWLDLYMVIMPSTGILCAVLVVLWSLASPEASAARRNSIASGLVSQRYEAARLRTALHDVSLNEVVDQAASRDAWNAVSRNLGLPMPQQNLPALPPAQTQPAQGYYYYPQPVQPAQAGQPLHQQPAAGGTIPTTTNNAGQSVYQNQQAYYPHAMTLVPTGQPVQSAAPAPGVAPAAFKTSKAAQEQEPHASASASASEKPGWLDLPIVRQLIAAYSDKSPAAASNPNSGQAHNPPASPAASGLRAAASPGGQHFAAASGPSAPAPTNREPDPAGDSSASDLDHDSDGGQGALKNS